jgi:predicted transcriptional regulator
MRLNSSELSRREREIQNILFRLGKASAGDVQAQMTNPPSYSTVRALLRILEEKGHVTHEEDGKRYLFLPTQAHNAAASSALRGVLRTFFEGSMAGAVKTMLSDAETNVSDDELAQLAQLIDQARRPQEEK